MDIIKASGAMRPIGPDQPVSRGPFLLLLALTISGSFFVWYECRHWCALPATKIASYGLTTAFSKDVPRAWLDGSDLVVERRVESARGRISYSEVRFKTAPAGTGLPLFVGLALVSVRSIRDAAKALVGIASTIVMQALILFAMVVVNPAFVGLLRGADGRINLWLVHAADLTGYLGVNIFQTMLPIILWIVLYPQLALRLVPSLARLRRGR